MRKGLKREKDKMRKERECVCVCKGEREREKIRGSERGMEIYRQRGSVWNMCSG